MTLAYGRSAPRSVTARRSRREQPLALTPALVANGRSRRLSLRYCGSLTQTSPNVVCHWSFFYPLGGPLRLRATRALCSLPVAAPTPASHLAPCVSIPASR